MVTSFLYLNRQCIIYFGLFIIIPGIIGNTINIIVFVSARNYRTTPSTFYYLVDSILNALIMLIVVGPRLLYDGFAIELGLTSNMLCKFRRYFSGMLSFTSLFYKCLAAIDQFCATSSTVRIRNWSNIKWAHSIVIIVFVVGCLYGIPYFLFGNLVPNTSVCVYTDNVFQVYVPLYIFIVNSATVGSVLMIFGCLAYQNIRNITALVERGAPKQVTRMVYMQTILVVVCLTPYALYNIYLWSKFGIPASIDPNSIEYIFNTTTALLTWVPYAV